MKKFLFGLAFGIIVGTQFFCPAPEEPAYCAENSNLTCSAAKHAASKVCDCQLVCYEDGK